MDEYINRENVLDNSNIITVQTKEYGSIEVIPVDTIADIELADVQPMKHGNWIDVYTWTMFHEFKSSGRGERFWCSECEQGQKQKSNFCPYCGVRMDLKG